MPVAIFILVIMAGFAATLNKMTGQTAVMVPQEVLSTAAFYAAESGAQLALHEIFYSTSSAIDRVGADVNCAAVTSPLSFPSTAIGLSSCSVTITCSISNDAENTISFYNIASIASCGVGVMTAQRTIDVSSFIQ